MSKHVSEGIARFVVASAFAVLPVCAVAQQSDQAVRVPAVPSVTTPAPSAAASAVKSADTPAKKDAQVRPVPLTPAKAPAAKSKLARWIEFQTGSLASRYRYVETSKGVVTAQQGQFQGQGKMRFNFDPKARLSVTAMFGTGNGFTSSWNNTGIGTGDFVRSWALKQIYVAAVPTPGVEMSFGSIGFVRGESTEITSYDNDGYMAGERISIKRPKTFYFDEVAATSAVLGYTSSPAFWDRADSLGESRNYFQYFASKKITKTLAASADYTRVSGVGTFRTGIGVKTPKAVVVDAVRYEQYFRGGPKADNGFAVFAEKNITKKISAGFGYANIDPNYGSLNADRFGKGKRFYQTASVKVTPEFSFQMFMAQAAGNDIPISNKYRIDVIASYNVLGRIQRAGHLK